jgi:5-methylcytosine-specific restriction endonuclease McrA
VVGVAPGTPRAALPDRTPGLERLVDELAAFVRSLHVEDLDGGEVLAMFDQLARATKIADAGRTLLAGRIDECGLHHRTGQLSAAHLVAAASGVTVNEASGAVETGRRLAMQVGVDEAFREGRLSFDQASSISRAVAVDPTATRGLLELARREPLRTLRDEVKRIVAAAEDDRVGRYQRQRAARSFRHGTDVDGMAWGYYRLPPDAGAALVNRVETETDRLSRAAYGEGRGEARDRHAADALVGLVTGSSAGAHAAPAPEVVVMIDLDALRRDRVDGEEVCVIPGFGPVPVEVPRRLLEGNPFLTVVVREGSRVHAVRRFGKRIPADLRTALLVEQVLRNGEVRCAVAGCDRTRVQWDHVRPTAYGGMTEMANLQPLCVAHHAQKTAAETGSRAVSHRNGHDPP